MGKIIIAPNKLTLGEVQSAIWFDQPELRAEWSDGIIRVSGTYLLFEPDVTANPDGPISKYEIEIILDEVFPRREPRVSEVGGRIPRNHDHHINPDGSCCVTVWEHWLLSVQNHSFAAFLNGPVCEYFLGQYLYEQTGKWPFGERPHGIEGLEEAYADALGIENRTANIVYHLRILSKDWPKGHWLCPCGSGELLRLCHWETLIALHEKIPPTMAKRMLRRMRNMSAALVARNRLASQRVC